LKLIIDIPPNKIQKIVKIVSRCLHFAPYFFVFEDLRHVYPLKADFAADGTKMLS